MNTPGTGEGQGEQPEGVYSFGDDRFSVDPDVYRQLTDDAKHMVASAAALILTGEMRKLDAHTRTLLNEVGAVAIVGGNMVPPAGKEW